ncbi:MAG: exodeoxyribonuclease VII large subunit [Alkalilacustris sp.]
MMDLFEEAGGNAPELSVSEISGAVKRVIEGEFGRIRVRGEVGRVSRPRSGHVYLDLKDDRSVLAAVIWKGSAARLETQPEEGMEVVATGRLTTFAGQSRYQMVIEDVAPAGLGALMAMLEKRRVALAAEGLFDAARKRPIPYLPRVIGVVTSPTGAVIRDILHRLADRFPCRVLVWPVAVQGAACAGEVAAAIRGFNALDGTGAVPRPDLLIVARGGGSVEDLWGFNEEAVVRAAADSTIPLISAVGHETDTTLIDLAADRRAPTPSAAAEMAVPVRLELLAWSDGQGARLTRALGTALERRGQRLRDLARALPRPEALLGQAAQRLDLTAERLPRALETGLQAHRLRLDRLGAGLRPRLLADRLVRLGREAAGLGARLLPGLERGTRARAERLAGLRLPRAALLRRLAEDRRRLSLRAGQIDTAVGAGLGRLADRLAALDRLRQSLDHTATLRRGFVLVRAGERVVTDAAGATAAPALDLEFHDGRVAVRPAGPRPRGSAGRSGPGGERDGGDGGQGRLI